jgi:hypothetical protein
MNKKKKKREREREKKNGRPQKSAFFFQRNYWVLYSNTTR